MDIDALSQASAKPAVSAAEPRGTGNQRTAALRVRVTSDEDTEGLTLRQRKVLNVIRDWIDQYGYPPSVREIGEAVGLTSTSSVAYQLRALERKGFLRRDPSRPRAVGMVPTETEGDFDPLAEPKPAYVPVLGSVAASGQIVSEESIDDEVPLPREIVGEGELFMLRMVGDSMATSIEDGDWVVVRTQATADNGEIIVALIDSEATVRTLKHKDDHVWLLPQNDAYEPINGDNATILGKVVTVLRSLLTA
ncbi:transcriptional repressor LexA [Lentzea tibetensis]|uniref:LexA repressor n=1 Tax=Lentzea tibetensis TaxID=2591470 RepID=A0A563EF51_9PSEU|nr:transcriptional repressor LexA [Lentzea tibetensis]TWP43318.1 transcriptional repressor LexA [Lentzea tibetensis]